MKNWMKLTQIFLLAFAAVAYQQPDTQEDECTICRPNSEEQTLSNDNKEMSRRRV